MDDLSAHELKVLVTSAEEHLRAGLLSQAEHAELTEQVASTVAQRVRRSQARAERALIAHRTGAAIASVSNQITNGAADAADAADAEEATRDTAAASLGSERGTG